MSDWDATLLWPVRPQEPLAEQVRALCEQQRRTWPAFQAGEAALDRVKVKNLHIDNGHVAVQANPGRRLSTHAGVDPASVARRPCFLCPHALPPLERGVPFGDYVVLPNPYPILGRHVTVASKRHVPQSLEDRAGDLLALARSLGPEMFVFYNGPRCGASAPDHMHFQACSSDGVPLFTDLPPGAATDRVVPLVMSGRNLLAGSFAQPEQARLWLQSAVDALRRIVAEPGEPMLNIVVLWRADRYLVNLFPRAKHRSACFFAEPPNRISISPAAMEMAGIVVVADVNHFDRVDGAVVRSIYEEVTLGPDPFSRLVEAVT